jgi:hypothetical protein
LRNSIAFVAVLVALVAASNARASETVRQMLGGRVELTVPSELVPMTEEMKKVKYPTNNPPQEVLTDERGTVNVASSLAPKPPAAKPDQLVVAMATAIGRMRNISIWHDKGTTTINGREFGFLEFTGLTLDTEVYSYIYFTFEGEEMIVLTVNSTISKLPEWKSALKKVVASTRIKPAT